jgi:hypothetical protein
MGISRIGSGERIDLSSNKWPCRFLSYDTCAQQNLLSRVPCPCIIILQMYSRSTYATYFGAKVQSSTLLPQVIVDFQDFSFLWRCGLTGT